MAETRTGNSIKNSGATIIGRIASMLIEFVLRTVLIRYLGIQYGGISTLFADILQVLSLAELGLGGAIIYALYKPIAEKDYRKINALMHFYKNAYNAIAIAIFFMGLCCIPILDKLVKDVPDVKEDIRLIFILYVTASSCSYLVIYKETLIKASQMSRVVVLIENGVKIVFMVAESILLIIFREYIIYLVLRIVSQLVTNVLISKEVNKRFPEIDFKCKDKLEKKDRQLLRKNIQAMALYKISGVVLNGTDSIIISTFLGTGIVGVIGQYRMILNFVSNMVNNIWISVLPSVGNLAALDGEEKQYRIFNNLKFGSFVFSAIITVGMFVLINPLVGIWVGQEYTVSTATAAAIAFNMYLFLTILPFQTFREANGLFVQGKYRPVIMAAINVGLSLALVKPWGLFGVLFATPVSRLLTQTWFDPFVVYKHVFRKKPMQYYLEFIKHSVLTLSCSWASWQVYAFLDISNRFFGLIAGMAICVSIPVAIYIVLFHKQCIQLLSHVKTIVTQVSRHVFMR